MRASFHFLQIVRYVETNVSCPYLQIFVKIDQCDGFQHQEPSWSVWGYVLNQTPDILLWAQNSWGFWHASDEGMSKEIREWIIRLLLILFLRMEHGIWNKFVKTLFQCEKPEAREHMPLICLEKVWLTNAFFGEFPPGSCRWDKDTRRNRFLIGNGDPSYMLPHYWVFLIF
jgi:hypothetical protein